MCRGRSILVFEVDSTCIKGAEVEVSEVLTWLRKESELLSPVDLSLDRSVPLSLPALQRRHFSRPTSKARLTNNGWTVVFSGKWDGTRPYIFGGPFLGKYVFSMLHFHWAENDTLGSEHSADGQEFPLEMHVVYFKAKYMEYEEAVKHDDGLVFEVHFFYIQPDDNTSLNRLIKKLCEITKAGMSTELEATALKFIFMPFTSDYFLYGGRIISQKGGHKVIWIISRRPSGISHGQMIGFRTLCGEDGRSLLRNIHYLYEFGNRRLYHVNMSQYLIGALYPYPRAFTKDHSKLHIQFRKLRPDPDSASHLKRTSNFLNNHPNPHNKTVEGHVRIDKVLSDKQTQIVDAELHRCSQESIFSEITIQEFYCTNMKTSNCQKYKTPHKYCENKITQNQYHDSESNKTLCFLFDDQNKISGTYNKINFENQSRYHSSTECKQVSGPYLSKRWYCYKCNWTGTEEPQPMQQNSSNTSSHLYKNYDSIHHDCTSEKVKAKTHTTTCPADAINRFFYNRSVQKLKRQLQCKKLLTFQDTRAQNISGSHNHRTCNKDTKDNCNNSLKNLVKNSKNFITKHNSAAQDINKSKGIDYKIDTTRQKTQSTMTSCTHSKNSISQGTQCSQQSKFSIFLQSILKYRKLEVPKKSPNNKVLIIKDKNKLVRNEFGDSLNLDAKLPVSSKRPQISFKKQESLMSSIFSAARGIICNPTYSIIDPNSVKHKGNQSKKENKTRKQPDINKTDNIKQKNKPNLQMKA